MSALSSPAIKRLEYIAQVETLAPMVFQKKSSDFIKYTAAAAVIFTIGFLGWNQYETKQLQEQYAQQQLDVEKKIQSATFIIDHPLPTIQLNVSKETPKNFHIIAGSFKFPKNAERKLKQLKAKGFKAEIIGKNKWGLTQVTYSSHETRTEAYKNLKETRHIASEDAWLLIKKLQ
jgi:hypothetical protein